MILIDERDGSRELAQMAPIEDRCALGRLDFGDAMLTGHGPNSSTITVGVEVKSVADALQSISTGRLGGHQIPGMLRSYDVSFLLVHGHHRVGRDHCLEVRRGDRWQQYRVGRRAVPWSYLEGFFLSAQILATLQSKPLFVKQVHDLFTAACYLATLDHWLEKEWDKHRALSVFDKSRETPAPPGMNGVEEQMARTAASLPAIDWVRGWAAARHFNSVQEMINAEASEWQKIPKFGPVISKAAVQAIRRRK